MLTGKTIVCLSTIDWDYLWQQHQAVMSILADAGNRVLFIENTGVRTPGWRDRQRVMIRLRNWSSGRGRFRPVRGNVFRYSPIALPFPYSRLAQYFNRRLVCEPVRRWVDHVGGQPPILFSFLPTQLMLDLALRIRPALTVFYCTDKLSETSAAAQPLVSYEREALRRSDLVFASSRRLEEYCHRENVDTHFFPIGVSLERFDPTNSRDQPEPEDLAKIPRPRIGLIGGLRQCVDQQLLEGVSSRLPSASVVLVGPEQVPFDRLRRLPNVHLLGRRDHGEVARYIRGFDVCLIPYVVDHFTDNISPAKLNEYLAMGKPVVSTALHEVKEFDRDHGGVVRVAHGLDGFVRAIEEGLRDVSPAIVLRRREVAKRNAWGIRVEAMSEMIEAKLRESRHPRAEPSLRSG